MKVGKPLKYTPESLQKIIDDYFKTTPITEYTITGLALKIGSRQLIQDYEKRKGFTEIIRFAKLIVENAYELSLRKTGRSGDIFALKNFGWKDQQDIKQTLTVKGISNKLKKQIRDNIQGIDKPIECIEEDGEG